MEFQEKPKSHRFIDIEGNKYGRLTVIGYAGKPYPGKNTYWWCKCECGTEKVIKGSHLKDGRTSSCGCLLKEVPAIVFGKHLGARYDKSKRHPLYSTWCDIRKRCYNPNSWAYKYYGGQGVELCEEWYNDFAKFAEYMGEKPTPEHSIDRIDPYGNYEPGNVRWATRTEQANNKRKSKKNVNLSAQALQNSPNRPDD